MINNLLFILTIILYFGGIIISKKLWGKTGLYIWIIIGTVFANMEVNKLVNIFGMEMTLGNVLFASTFLVTDVMSECYGKKESKKAVQVGVFASICSIIITQIAIAFIPSSNDIMQESMIGVFAQIPRICFASLIGYVIVQFWDVFMYHKLWNLTTKLSHNKEKFLWIRNNGSTLTSQLLNCILFNCLAFGGTYDIKTLVNIIISSYLIGAVLVLLDTPFIYIARRIKDNKEDKINEN